MFGFRKAKEADVLSHWYTLVDHFNISSKEFYSSVERELDRRKVPELKMSRVTFSEGGFFSANREYLRMKRERLVFDICAAPFGTSYFFSMRFAELPGRSWWLFLLYLLRVRKETYFRQDTRLMYLEIVNAVVRQRVAEFTSAGGINLLNIRQHSPLMDDLYRTTQVQIETIETPAPLEAAPT